MAKLHAFKNLNLVFILKIILNILQKRSAEKELKSKCTHTPNLGRNPESLTRSSYASHGTMRTDMMRMIIIIKYILIKRKSVKGTLIPGH